MQMHDPSSRTLIQRKSFVAWIISIKKYFSSIIVVLSDWSSCFFNFNPSKSIISIQIKIAIVTHYNVFVLGILCEGWSLGY